LYLLLNILLNIIFFYKYSRLFKNIYSIDIKKIYQYPHNKYPYNYKYEYRTNIYLTDKIKKIIRRIPDDILSIKSNIEDKE